MNEGLPATGSTSTANGRLTLGTGHSVGSRTHRARLFTTPRRVNTVPLPRAVVGSILGVALAAACSGGGGGSGQAKPAAPRTHTSVVELCAAPTPPTPVPVFPSVVGLMLQDALRRLSCDDGFRNIRVTPDNSPASAIVRAQTPLPGAPAGTRTLVVLSTNTPGIFSRRA